MFEDKLVNDKSLDPLFKELASRNSYKLLEGVFSELDKLILGILLVAEDDKDRLYCQAYYRCLTDLRKRVQKFRPQMEKETEIIVGGNLTRG